MLLRQVALLMMVWRAWAPRPGPATGPSAEPQNLAAVPPGGTSTVPYRHTVHTQDHQQISNLPQGTEQQQLNSQAQRFTGTSTPRRRFFGFYLHCFSVMEAMQGIERFDGFARSRIGGIRVVTFRCETGDEAAGDAPSTSETGPAGGSGFSDSDRSLDCSQVEAMDTPCSSHQAFVALRARRATIGSCYSPPNLKSLSISRPSDRVSDGEEATGDDGDIFRDFWDKHLENTMGSKREIKKPPSRGASFLGGPMKRRHTVHHANEEIDGM